MEIFSEVIGCLMFKKIVKKKRILKFGKISAKNDILTSQERKNQI